MSEARGVLGVYLRDRSLEKQHLSMLVHTHTRKQYQSQSYISLSMGNKHRMTQADPFFVFSHLDGCSCCVLFPFN